MGLVLLPPFAVLTTTTLLKLAAVFGVKLISKFVVAKPGRVKGVPETVTNGPLLIVAIPFVNVMDTRWESTNGRETGKPTPTVPKSKPKGKTAMGGGVKPLPLTELVLLPPLLRKITLLLIVPVFVGLKLTVIKRVSPLVKV